MTDDNNWSIRDVGDFESFFAFEIYEPAALEGIVINDECDVRLYKGDPVGLTTNYPAYMLKDADEATLEQIHHSPLYQIETGLALHPVFNTTLGQRYPSGVARGYDWFGTIIVLVTKKKGTE